MNATLDQAALFLITTVFDLYLTLLAVRFILAWSGSDYLNPITLFISKVTHPLIKVIRRIIPTYANVEYATLFLLIFLESIKLLLVYIILSGYPDLSILLIMALHATLRLILNIFFYSIFLQAIILWIQPHPTPLNQVLTLLTAPILKPLQRIIPPIGGMDLTPIPALILIQLLLMLV